MAEHLKIDGTTMIAAISNIRSAQDDFDRLGDLEGEIQSAAGCHAFTSATNALKSALGDAAGGWTVHRKELSQALKALGEAMAQCIEQFESTDQELAKGMKPS